MKRRLGAAIAALATLAAASMPAAATEHEVPTTDPDGTTTITDPEETTTTTDPNQASSTTAPDEPTGDGEADVSTDGPEADTEGNAGCEPRPGEPTRVRRESPLDPGDRVRRPRSAQDEEALEVVEHAAATHFGQRYAGGWHER